MAGGIRVGVVGIGWGGNVHVPAFRSVPEYEVAALCGRRADHLAEVAGRLEIEDTSTDWQTFIRRPDLDLIAIATPVDLHAPMALAAIAAGKHVLCEKPLAVNAAQALEMTQAAEAAGIANAVGFEARWLPERIALAEFVAAGGLGSPFLVQVSTNNGAWHPSAPAPADWKLSADQGGGYINAMACHDIDLVRWLFGEPLAVAADTRAQIAHRQLPGGREVAVDTDDTAGIILRLDSGALAIVSGTALSAHGTGYRLEAAGSAGTVAIDSGQDGVHGFTGAVSERQKQPLEVSQRQPRGSLAVDSNYPFARVVRATALMLEEWLPAFSGAPTPVASFRDGLRIQQLIDAARASSAGAGWVDVSPH
jgi:predicted dehydrogenase